MDLFQSQITFFFNARELEFVLEAGLHFNMLPFCIFAFICHILRRLNYWILSLTVLWHKTDGQGWRGSNKWGYFHMLGGRIGIRLWINNSFFKCRYISFSIKILEFHMQYKLYLRGILYCFVETNWRFYVVFNIKLVHTSNSK